MITQLTGAPITDFMPAELKEQIGANPYNRLFSSNAPKYNVGPQRVPPIREREMSPQEILNVLDRKNTLRMVYIPHLLTQCVICYIDLIIEYARANKLTQYRKLTRTMQLVKEDYYQALLGEMRPQLYERFNNQREDFLNLCGFNIQKAFYTFNNAMLKQYGRVPNDIIRCYANIVIALVNYVNDFDRKVNAEIAEKLKTPCRNNKDARLNDLRVLCTQIAEPFVVKSDSQIKLMIDIMANKAESVINDML